MPTVKLTTVRYGKVKKSKKMTLVVSALIRKGNKVLLVKRKKGKYFSGFWGLPTGKVELGEKLEDALKREVKEETNLKIKVLNLYHITQEFHDDHHHVVFAFKTKIVSGTPQAKSDASEVKWFSKNEIKKLKLQPTTKEQLRMVNFA